MGLEVLAKVGTGGAPAATADTLQEVNAIEAMGA
jgi:hypothetical protein